MGKFDPESDGSIRFCDYPAIAIINSSHGKYPTGSDPWIQRTREILSHLSNEKVVLLTSVGSLNWELLSYLASQSGMRQRVILPITRGHLDQMVSETQYQLGIDPDLVEYQPMEVSKNSLRGYGLERDSFILGQADHIYPISIRPKGRMEFLLKDLRPVKKVDASMSITWNPPLQCITNLPDPEVIRKSVDLILAGWLIHWTRACQGPWPGERKCDFFADLLTSTSEYSHSARKTLQHIMVEKKIRASNWRISGGHPVVAFSALPPSEALGLMRWRSRYVRYSFEPFGIAVEPGHASASGIRKVIYHEAPKQHPEGIPEYLLQGSGRVGNWPNEQEYRHLGDFDFSTSGSNQVRSVDLMEMVIKANKQVDEVI